MFSSCKVFNIHWYLDLIKLVHALSLYASFIRFNESASHTHTICNISVEISMFSSCKVSTVSWYWDSVEFLSCPILIRNGQNVECMHAIFNIGRQFFYLEPLELVNYLKFWYKYSWWWLVILGVMGEVQPNLRWWIAGPSTQLYKSTPKLGWMVVLWTKSYEPILQHKSLSRWECIISVKPTIFYYFEY